jgi:hypothetical protein
MSARPRSKSLVGLLRPALLVAAALCVGSTGCGPTNVEACTAYVEKVNAEYAACGVVERIDVGSTCPAYLDRGGADCSEYYACLGDEIQCRNGTLYHRGEDGDPNTPDDRRCTGCV